jgi:hypothetical protein
MIGLEYLRGPAANQKRRRFQDFTEFALEA